MNDNKNPPVKKTDGLEYTDLLMRKQMAWWKRLLNVQAPYRWNIRRLQPGFTLDIGCGIGRNLVHLQGQGVGVDHNPQSIGIARRQGLRALTPNDFFASDYNVPQQFDSILLAHVAEHMHLTEATELLKKYLPNLKAGGKIIIITPQEAGYKSDATHIEFMDFTKLRNIINQLGLELLHEYSFPFPRFVGRFFLYNEFVSVSRKAEVCTEAILRPGTA